MRAQRHVAALEPGREHGFLAMLEATVALNTGDLEGSLARIEDAVRIGREVSDPELTAMAIHTQGLAMIDTGHVAEGLALLDEAMAATVAGEVGPYFTGIIYCSLLSACLAIGDLRRAGEWSDAAVDWCATIPPDSPYPGMCRANRAEVARLRGAWGEAEEEAERACDELLDVEPVFAAAAFLQLAEIRRRRGDLAGAEAAYTNGRTSSARIRSPDSRCCGWRRASGPPPGPRSPAALGAAGPAPAPHRVRLHAANVEIALADGSIDDALASAAASSVDDRGGDRGAGVRRAGGRGAPGRSRSRPGTSTAPWRDLREACDRDGRSCACRTRRARPGAVRAGARAPPGTRRARRSSSAPRSPASSGWGRSATPARSRASGRRPAPCRRAHRARGRGPAPGRIGQDEPRHRRGARDQRAHRRAAPPEHLREARGVVARRGHGIRVRARAHLTWCVRTMRVPSPGWWVPSMRRPRLQP